MKGIILALLLFIPLWVIAPEAWGQGADAEVADKYLARAQYLYLAAHYDSLPYYYAEARKFYEQLDSSARSAECLLGMVDYYRVRGNFPMAIKWQERAEYYILANLGKGSEAWADSRIRKAKLYFSQRRLKEAISLLDAGISSYNVMNFPKEKLIPAYNALGAVYFEQGNLDSAEICYQMAYELECSRINGPTVIKGVLFFNIGLLYSARDDPDRWAEYTLRGIENNLAVYGPGFQDLADNYSSLASAYMLSGELDSANSALDRAAELIQKNHGVDPPELCRIYINRARIRDLEGDLNAALEYYGAAEALIGKYEQLRPVFSDDIYSNLGRLYSSRGEYRKALGYFSELLKLEGSLHPGKMANYYTNLGIVHMKLGEFAVSEEYLGKVLAIRSVNSKKDSPELYRAYNAYADLMDSLHRYSVAEKYYEDLLRLAVKNYGQFHYLTARALKYLGDHYYRTGQPESALENYQQTLHSLDPGYNTEAIGSNPPAASRGDLLFYLRLLKQKASVLKILAAESGERDSMLLYKTAAYKTLLSSIEIIELLRMSYLSDESRIYLSDIERSTYESAVSTAMDCYQITNRQEFLAGAFETAERSKYATLRYVLQREDALRLIPDSIRDRENSLSRQMVAIQELLIEAGEDTLPSEAGLKRYKNDILEARDKISALHRYIGQKYPEYYDLLYEHEPASPEELMAKLGRDETLVEYFRSGSELFIFTINRTGFNGESRSIDEDLDSDLDLIKNYISSERKPDPVNEDHQSFLKTSHRLYRMLLPDLIPGSSLIIIPEGRLDYFPFDILVEEPVTEFSGLYRDVPFLICSHNIRYGYSASLLYGDRRKRAGKVKGFIGFAPGYLEQDGPAATPASQRGINFQRTDLAALPGSIKEVEQISALLGGTAFTGERATEANFRKAAVRGQILHLATHALLDDVDPLKSTLVFAKTPDQDEDGLLRVYELYNLGLKARLVVLSACNTGLGEIRRGEGIMSLARAFIYSGARNIIMTLWTVSDEESADLMISFYSNLKKGNSTEYALRKAKLDYLQNANPRHQHPRYWAGYILVGDPGNLFMPWRFFILVFLILSAGLVAIPGIRKLPSRIWKIFKAS